MSNSRGLLSVLGLGFGLAVLVGNTIGMGILRTPGVVAAHLPSVPWYLAVWVIGALYALLGALTLAELAAMHPRSGGLFPLVERGLGRYAGLVSGWTDWVATCCSVAAVAMVFGEYVEPYAEALRGQAAWIAAGVVAGFALLQARGIRLGSRVQTLSSLLKALALVALAVVALWATPAAAPPAAADLAPLPSGLALAAAVVVALQSAIYTYDGWSGPVYFGEEVRDPGRDLPRAMIGGVLLVLAIYLLLNLAFLRVVPIAEMAGDPFVAATAATRLFGAAGESILRALMLISLLAAISALLLMASRVPHALAHSGLLPARFGRANAGGTPVLSLAFSTLLALVFLGTRSFDAVLALLAFFFVANYVLAFTALFVLRRREPEAPRPFRVPGYPWIPGLALLSSVVFLIAAILGDLQHSLLALAVLGLSVPAYALTRRSGR